MSSSKDRDFQEFFEVARSAADYADIARASRSRHRCSGAVRKEAGFRRFIGSQTPAIRGGIEGMIPRLARVAKPLRCYAPEEFGHSIPSRVVQVHHGALVADSMT